MLTGMALRKLGFVLQGSPCQNVYAETLIVRLLNCIRDLFFLTKFQGHQIGRQFFISLRCVHVFRISFL